MEPSSSFAAFVTILDEGSISAAARSLGESRAALSRRLAALEESLGVRLVHRSTRKLVPTRAGEELARRARRIVELTKEATDAVQRLDGVPRGLLRVSIPPGGHGFAPMLLEFLDKYPAVSIEVDASTRHVDMRAEGIDVAIRAGSIADPTLIARTLWRGQIFAVASPSYIGTHGTPKTPEDLKNHALIAGFARGVRPVSSWPLLDGGSVEIEGRLTTNDLQLRRQAAIDGRGIALLPEPLIRADLAHSALTKVLDGVVGATTAMALVYPERAFLDPKVRAFVDHTAEWADKLLPTPPFELPRTA